MTERSKSILFRHSHTTTTNLLSFSKAFGELCFVINNQLYKFIVILETFGSRNVRRVINLQVRVVLYYNEEGKLTDTGNYLQYCHCLECCDVTSRDQKCRCLTVIQYFDIFFHNSERIFFNRRIHHCCCYFFALSRNVRKYIQP